MRDVRVLRDLLVSTAEWAAAAAAYGEEHDRYYARLHRQHDWGRELFFEVGPAADAKRATALPRLNNDPSRRPDLVALGPEAPGDEAARRRFFGLD